MTEDALVAALRAIVEEPPALARAPRSIVLGIGDDAAAWQPSRSHLSVITSDVLVDGVHFQTERMSPKAIGHRALAANLSDIAAMGARPVLATIALGISDATNEDWILDCYRGLQALAAAQATVIAGGDISRAPVAFLSITIVGEVARPRLRRRSGGRPGDVLAVTGTLGASRAGLELLGRELPVAEADRIRATAAFQQPEPRIAEGRWLAASMNVHAMIDCSDGLSTDADRLARASGCGATLFDVPVAPAARAVAEAAGADATSYALDGGEDFELIAALDRRAFAYLGRRYERRFGRPLLAVGRLEAEPGLRLREGDVAREIAPRGWDHLSRNA